MDYFNQESSELQNAINIGDLEEATKLFCFKHKIEIGIYQSHRDEYQLNEKCQYYLFYEQ